MALEISLLLGGWLSLTYWMHRRHRHSIRQIESRHAHTRQVLEEAHNELKRLHNFDAITQLANRNLFNRTLNRQMLKAVKQHKQLAVIFIDLDGFKRVNSRFGHETGDQLLRFLAQPLAEVLPEPALLARIGGDEFAAVIPDLEDKDEIQPLLHALLRAARTPFEYHGHRLHLSASIGLTFYPQDDEVDADQLLRQADQAMYAAKIAGKNRCMVFNSSEDKHLRGHNELLEQLRRAIDLSELVLFYQPKVNMRSGQVIGMEALIRWQHPEKGLLAPAYFLPVIENHPLSIALGEWVISQALHQHQLWLKTGFYLPISVNISGYHLQQADFTERLKHLLGLFPKVKAGALEIEILETVALEDIKRVTETLNACRKMGVNFALDDFGTGYSSLTYLRHLPTQVLKIDQSFVRGMLQDAEDFSILEGIFGLSLAFDRELIAEGVASEAHGCKLLEMGCELGQGYAIAKPMPAEAIQAWVEEWKPPTSWTQTQKLTRCY
ncbi:putative bifunctional diguanylate cyclase/phosphodiesterase [Nitrincola tapanii]|uniref:EAL domain-containing protein n=1 Tax=Nitrincola tapanii TaxID=1708751 RepID=A0A5A9W0T8_9GAMM|nr:EAL domain-containing protein [Nitrincola tapanii]KAA0874163.1 EAL domain-containing protein [Nitrincola tapanii]